MHSFYVIFPDLGDFVLRGRVLIFERIEGWGGRGVVIFFKVKGWIVWGGGRVISLFAFILMLKVSFKVLHHCWTSIHKT